MHARMSAPLIAAALLLALSAEAGTIRDDRPDSAYTSLASLPVYAPVGQLTYNTSGGGFLCSGTLIASRWVLTAAHCLDDGTTSNVQFQVGGNVYGGSSWQVFPTWTGNLSAGNDIAVLQLASQVTGVSFATLNPGINPVGATGTYVGYGTTGTGLTGYTSSAGTKRAGTNVIDTNGLLEGISSNILLADFDNPGNPADSRYGSSTPLDLEYLIAPGDSGGGLFFDFGGTTYLTGVHSFLAAVDGVLDADYGDLSGDTNVEPFVGWINSFTASAVPAPASVLLMLVGMAGLPLTRRRRA